MIERISILLTNYIHEIEKSKKSKEDNVIELEDLAVSMIDIPEYCGTKINIKV